MHVVSRKKSVCFSVDFIANAFIVVIIMCYFVTSQIVNFVAGTATRLCLENNEWDDPYVLNCLPEEYQNLLDQVGYTCTLSLLLIVCTNFRDFSD